LVQFQSREATLLSNFLKRLAPAVVEPLPCRRYLEFITAKLEPKNGHGI